MMSATYDSAQQDAQASSSLVPTRRKPLRNVLTRMRGVQSVVCMLCCFHLVLMLFAQGGSSFA